MHGNCFRETVTAPSPLATRAWSVRCGISSMRGVCCHVRIVGCSRQAPRAEVDSAENLGRQFGEQGPKVDMSKHEVARTVKRQRKVHQDEKNMRQCATTSSNQTMQTCTSEIFSSNCNTHPVQRNSTPGKFSVSFKLGMKRRCWSKAG